MTFQMAVLNDTTLRALDHGRTVKVLRTVYV
jgi:hypothetical protein